MARTILFLVLAALAGLIAFRGDVIGDAVVEAIFPSDTGCSAPLTPATSHVSLETPPPERVEAGSAGLLRGIPGEGPLSVAEVAEWLDDPANHRVVEQLLPLGLDAGALDARGLRETPLTRAKIELGRQLYFDQRLSGDGTVSCATCHDPDHGYAAPTRFGVGVDEQQGTRNSPTAYNRVLSGAQFWDGRSGSLEAQAVGPIANPVEMASSHEACVEFLTVTEGYRLQFARIFADGVTIENVGKAIASFERALVTGPSAWDLDRRLEALKAAVGDDLASLREEDPEFFAEIERVDRMAKAKPLSVAARRGAELFFSDAAGCSQCHVGANFTDEQYHNLGVGFETASGPDDPSVDWGRFNVTGEEADRGAFKTPTLRNVAQTPPYMHDGSQETLEEVIAWYVIGGHENPWLSEKIAPLELDGEQQADLVEFLEALTGELPEVERARLPE